MVSCLDIEDIESVEDIELSEVYDLTIDDNSNYFIFVNKIIISL